MANPPTHRSNNSRCTIFSSQRDSSIAYLSSSSIATTYSCLNPPSASYRFSSSTFCGTYPTSSCGNPAYIRINDSCSLKRPSTNVPHFNVSFSAPLAASIASTDTTSTAFVILLTIASRILGAGDIMLKSILAYALRASLADTPIGKTPVSFTLPR